jgi:hypothetical protein
MGPSSVGGSGALEEASATRWGGAGVGRTRSRRRWNGGSTTRTGWLLLRSLLLGFRSVRLRRDDAQFFIITELIMKGLSRSWTVDFSKIVRIDYYNRIFELFKLFSSYFLLVNCPFYPMGVILAR